MDRDPLNRDVTRDPIYLIQAKRYGICCLYDWVDVDGDDFVLGDVPPEFQAAKWMFQGSEQGDFSICNNRDFMEHLAETEAPSGHNYMAFAWWETESVELTRPAADDYLRRNSHNYYYGHRVYCIPCDGLLAKVLNNAPDPNERPLTMLDAILAEYRYWRQDDELELCRSEIGIGAMGACSNLLTVAAGLTQAKTKGNEWYQTAIEFMDREMALYAFLGASREDYPSPVDAVRVFVLQIKMVVMGFAGMSPAEVEEATGAKISRELFESLQGVASIETDADGDADESQAESSPVEATAITAEGMESAGWSHQHSVVRPEFDGEVDLFTHPSLTKIKAIGWPGKAGFSVFIDSVEISDNATVGDLMRLEALLDGVNKATEPSRMEGGVSSPRVDPVGSSPTSATE